MFFRPRAGIRKKLSEIKEGDKEELKAILAKITIDDYETKFTGKSTVDFNNEDAYKELVGDFQKVKFDFEIDESKFGINIPNQLSVSKEVSFTFIKALRDVVSDFHNNRTNPLLTLLRNQSGKINEEEFKPISKRVRKLNEKIEALSDVQKIRTDIKGTIKEAVGETYAPSSLSIKSSLSDDAEKLLQSLRLFIGEPNESHEGGIHELSLGGANLIYLTLKLLEYKYQINKNTFANFLLIEEPEAHIHTHIQKTLFDNLDFGETQIIYSTHSTHISEVSKISSMNILAKKQNHAEVYQPAKNLDPKDITKLERYLDAVRSNLLFAKGVMLVEGDAEEILIPIMVKKVLGVSLDELGISLINIRSTGFKNVAQIFHEDRIKRRCSIITDLDKAIEETDKGAEKKGSERKKKLYIFSKDNEWIKIYCAEYTFEVDFVAERNEHEVKQLISEIYTDTKTINKAKNDIDSEEAIDYGKRVLTMANNVGKGWFAIMLGKHISFQTFIPEYILDALIFTKLDFNVETLSNITEYRVQKNKEIDDDGTDFDDLNLAIEEYRNNRIALHDLIPAIEATIPDDQIIKFLKRV